MIHTIQLSLTSRCNLNCVFCLSTMLKDQNNFSEKVDIDFQVVKKVIEYPTLKRLKLCPNRGESLLHPQFMDIIKLAKEKNIFVELDTNGFLNSPTWWFELGKLLNNEHDDVVFALDGVNNKTHNRYRASNFYKVLENMESFIKGGGKATWQFIKFQYNEHQASIAREIAKELGCKEFFLMNSHTYDVKHPPPTIKKIDLLKASIKKPIYLPCDDMVIYISCKGIVFPCCFVNTMYAHKPHRRMCGESHLIELYEKEEEFLNLSNNELDTIIEKSEFINTILNNKGKTKVCIERCLKFNRNVNYRGEI